MMNIIVNTNKRIPDEKDIAAELAALGVGVGLIMDALGVSLPTAKKILKGESVLSWTQGVSLIKMIGQAHDLVEINASSFGVDAGDAKSGEALEA